MITKDKITEIFCIIDEFDKKLNEELKNNLQMMLFMKLYTFGKCTGITFVDSTMIPVCHNVRRYFNKVFAGLAKDRKDTMGWCHGFKLHLLCNDSGEIITFCFTEANVCMWKSQDNLNCNLIPNWRIF